MHASSRGYAEIVRLLIEAGADPDFRPEGGMTPLMCAASRGYAEVVGLLLDAGADKDLKDGNDHTALKHASCYGHVKTVRLLEAGAASADKGLQEEQRDPAHVDGVKRRRL